MSSFAAVTALSLLTVASLLSLPSAEASRRGELAAAEFLSAINTARAEVSVQPLSWNATVAQNAKACRQRTPADAVRLWVDERQWYDRSSNTCMAGKQCRNYKLVVKRAWQQLGCAVVACAAGGELMACEYSPETNRLPDPKAPPY
ncbi:hypothetical protein PR202_ga30049 [Eleusine coracana subsp. coracana]|uniref:SCP domain-containing protein n=1 Tax=Eleusine coracana subsp. coracana TaxID=191504 RepID=A0AAV5DNA3_ELECO|nr:hypothetical protein PR202_ga30049 [Eleusine coracana subsp. coracana]